MTKKSAAPSPRRGGLGRGLGALIPTADTESVPTNSRPLDVLFPDLQKSSRAESPAPERGGSAKELLTPRKKQARPKNVSRETSRSEAHLVETPGASFALLPLEKIVPNQRQPRQNFEQSDLDELALSIEQVGLLQPVVVRKLPAEAGTKAADARYELIMGERRLRASEQLGLATIPAIIRATSDDDLLRDALLENLHRADLNPLEEAAAYAQLMEDFSCTQDELSQRIARSRPQITNTLRLLKLPPSVQQQVATEVISAGHARALLGLSSASSMESLAERIVAEGLSVRSTELIVRRLKEEGQEEMRAKRVRPEPSAFALSAASRVADKLDTQVRITEGKKKGRIVIDFADSEDLERIITLLS